MNNLGIVLLAFFLSGDTLQDLIRTERRRTRPGSLVPSRHLFRQLVIALVAGADRPFDLTREMVLYISPRRGFTAYALEIAAAGALNSVVTQAVPYRRGPEPRRQYRPTAVGKPGAL